MAKITATVHKTIKKLDAAIAIVSPRRGTSAAVVLATQLKQMLQSGRPFDIRWGETLRRIDSNAIRIHKSTITFALEDQDFDLQLSAIEYVQVGEDRSGRPVYETGFFDEKEGLSFVAAENVAAEKRSRLAA